jgi:signal peptidase I
MSTSSVTPPVTGVTDPHAAPPDATATDGAATGRIEPDVPRYGAGRLALGVFGRMWLWFLGGVLIVTLLPLLFGWRPYVVETGSMAPAIRAGDVVLSSPAPDPDLLLGRVIVFASPDRRDAIVTHRVVGLNDDGTLVTQGDNNQSADSAPVAPEQVRGLGRLLVRGAGLPMLWLRNGAWLQLLLLAASIWIAAVGVVRDHEEDEELASAGLEPSPAPYRPIRVIAATAVRSVGIIPRARRVEEPATDDDLVPAERSDGAAPSVRSLPRGRRRTGADVAILDTEASSDALPRASQVDAGDHHGDPEGDDERDDERDGDDHRGGPSGSPGIRVSQTGPEPRRTAPPPDPGRALRHLLGAIVAGLVLVGTPTIAAAAFTATTANPANAWSVPNVDYGAEVTARAPYLYWRLDDTNGNTAADSSGNGNTGRYRPNPSTGAFTRLADGALLTDTPDRAVQLNDPAACIETRSNTAIAGPQVYTVVAWFRAPSSYTDGGKLIGFERPQTGTDSPPNGNYDRQLYVDGNGRVWFTAYNGGHVALSSAPAFNDGNWHMAVGSQDAAGMRLYLDGALVASNGNTAAENTIGWWRAGCGNLAGWGGQWTGPNNPGTNSGTPQNRPFLGALDEITVYSGVSLNAADVASLWFAR